MTAVDVLGVVGVALILVAYAGLQTERLNPLGVTANALNLAGAGLILLSLAYDFNLSAVLMEGAWGLFAAYGLVRAIGRRRAAP